jgi:[acyl-carrier-protein] S-malonyltransferase
MAAVLGLDDEAVAAVCAEFPGPGVLEPANFNAPGQVVVAGNRAAITWLQGVAREKNIKKVLPLAMSVPSHCSLLRGAAAQLAEYLREVEIRPPAVPVLHNLDATARQAPDAIRTALTEQLYRPVRWSQIVSALAASGVDTFIECGPGRVLSNLGKRIVVGARFLALETPEGFAQALAPAAAEVAA